MLKTFSIQTLGCRVNHYESDQLATLLRARGLTEVPAGGDLRIVNTCSVTVQAASKSRQTVRRAVRLPVLREEVASGSWIVDSGSDAALSTINHPLSTSSRARVIVTGCWATSNPADASNLPGVDAVLGHHDDVAVELDRLLACWNENQAILPLKYQTPTQQTSVPDTTSPPAESFWDDGSMIQAGTPQRLSDNNNTHAIPPIVKKKVARNVIGTRSLPMLGDRQAHHQRAFLKIQDGCDAHCTYCIIPQLRPALWSKPVDACIEEARALVGAGHREIVLTGIFLGAYGQTTALRRRQDGQTAKPLADLVEALCTRVPDLHRLRFSSLEPGDLTDDLIERLRSHPQVVPHFHLPLQSGSDELLHRMNRQYSRGDFLRMVDQVQSAFDRPAITTDIIVGFPGETDAEFAQTLDIVDRVRFIHTHAFSFSPRPGTAAARWTDNFVRGPVVNRRIELLNERSQQHSFDFRKQFLGETVEVLVEQQDERAEPDLRHGRCERYFDIYFSANGPLPPSPGTPGEGRGEGSRDTRDSSKERQLAEGPHPNPLPEYRARESEWRLATGKAVRLRISRVTPQRTWGEVIE